MRRQTVEELLEVETGGAPAIKVRFAGPQLLDQPVQFAEQAGMSLTQPR
ncbi:MAG: hypothetical protein AB7I48_16705 [Planctomycetaceae bacterium]